MFWNIIWGFVIVGLILSGLLNAINWQINIWLIVAVFIIWLVTLYNSLIMMRNRVKEAWSDIEVQLKRRYDLIPNLVETVKGYMAHESGVFEKVTEARARAMGAGTKEEKLGAENVLSGTLKTLFAVSENYPELKANVNFLDLQRELADTENKIQAARRFYNGNVMDYNTKIEVLPTNLIAGAFGFKKGEFFGIENESERQPVKVKF
ncbi:MAG: LemA family protein [Candidatus Azambacteria bacterium]|nr:LemA family protein [Candidatus Azambacteria bacterium]